MEKRRKKDIQKLEDNGYVVTLDKDNKDTIYVDIDGPKDTIYENGKWTISIMFSKDYPYKSPSVGFITKIYHANIDFQSGSICLDVLNTEWTPIYNLLTIIKFHIPQLLSYPNEKDPLNEEAAEMMINDPEKYKKKVFETIEKYCK